MVKSFKLGLGTIYIYKESGNLYIRNKKGESKAIQYGAYCSHNEPLDLRDYMNLKGLSLIEAAKLMDECNVVLSGNSFSLLFHDIESVDKFVEKSLG